MKRMFVMLIVVVLAGFALASFLFLASKAASNDGISFTKVTSNTKLRESELFTYSLYFNTLESEDMTINVKITDANPAPEYLSIISDSITGGGIYVPSLDSIVWEGALEPNGTEPHTVTFQVLVTDIHPNTPLTGYPITNTAYIVDTDFPGSLPLQQASVIIYLFPHQLFLPHIQK
jgi:hypothetical protein